MEHEWLALYRGRSVGEACIVGVTADALLVRMVKECIDGGREADDSDDCSPRPWRVDAQKAQIVAADGRVVAKVAHFLRHGTYEATVVDDANARLIVSAVNEQLRKVRPIG